MKGFAKFSWFFMVCVFLADIFNPLVGGIFAGFAGCFTFIIMIFELNAWVRVSDYRTPKQIAGTGKYTDMKRQIYGAQVQTIPQTVKSIGVCIRIIAIVWCGLQIGAGGLFAIVMYASVLMGTNMNEMCVLDIPKEQWGMVGFPLYILAAVCSICVVVAVWKRATYYKNAVAGGANHERD